jgi:FMN phosphatase YigB (HAD superfamily)
MPFDCVILDFDGTFTDVEREAAPFVEIFQRDAFDIFGRDARVEWDEESQRLHDSPGAFGWRNGGVIMAPPNADPYIHSACVVQNLCNRFGVLSDEQLRVEVLQMLYRRAYPHTLAAPRPDAKQVLEDLLAREVALFVVTNSSTAAVTKKIAELEPKGGERLTVRGDAKKFVFADGARDARFDALDHMQLPGLERTTCLKRGYYYDTLTECWEASGTSPERTLVVGDIFELDLALPLALGCNVHLVHRNNVAQYEIDFVREHERCGAGTELSSLLARL